MQSPSSESFPRKTMMVRTKLKSFGSFSSVLLLANIAFMAIIGGAIINVKYLLLQEENQSSELRRSLRNTGTELATVKAGFVMNFKTSHHSHLSITPLPTTFQAAEITNNCVRLSTQPNGHAKHRIFVYQKQAGQQLVDLIIHYLQALTYDEIVVIANEEGNILKDTPAYNELISKGIHLWQCHGNRDEKGNRWTEVIKQYQQSSDFIQPVDVDEYLALLSPTGKSIVWDRLSLHSALDRLPVSNGKPYNTLDSKPVPLDCDKAIGKEFEDIKHQARHCNLRGFSEPTVSCYNKVFYRSEDFKETDVGNHFGKVESLWKCEKETVEAAFQPTTFLMLHYQSLDFQDWLVHALRLSTDANFNRLDLDHCPKGHDMPWHSCFIFREILEVKFDLYKVRELYRTKMCTLEPYLDPAGVTTMSC